MKFIIEDQKEIEKVAKFILSIFNDRPILLFGEIGTGKTTLVKAIGKELKIKELIKSPSFNKMNIYDNKIVHIDAYNLKESLDTFKDYFEDKIVIIEWADLIGDFFEDFVKVCFKIEENKRIIDVKYKSKGR
ncbi:tRNA (adenosine(37)-N6)-threonylcarbamoyltransferase complex ATPase subunit type 1 TsaE [[Mycoplasma] mobile]|uniref:tRNA threonylcarbamoyladenosine biosynthesis protein TsaE n=1 Tax=Mycoplasma mobile (strain ATCC 43663 / 163K / NCTC 11711) TaxID=267748 RepID=Q6KIF8_MYCM1|nr:tRNA (adenosine(37)-N6)-threonylcarbamoyltransferase complex ATPase subunit type 1 TsaE [[Mycoplasma] mobile]AAT27618.1 putative ATPase or kinase [Mycoplasma mobile 163K]